MPEPGDLNHSAIKLLLNAFGVAGVLAIVGYVCGLAHGGGNEHLLAVCFGAVGGLVVLLGYGPIAHLIRPLGGLAEWFHRNRTRSNEHTEIPHTRTEDHAE